MMKPLMMMGSALALCGCVAQSAALSVAPGQGKTYADLQRDDAACRGAPAAQTTQGQTTQAQAAAAQQQPPANYYQCMAARGELVVRNPAAVYPAYAAYPYPYAYPAYAYPYYGYGYGYPYFGYPYSAAYAAPFIGFGIGFGFGRGYYGRGYYGGYRGVGRAGFERGGVRGGGFHR